MKKLVFAGLCSLYLLNAFPQENKAIFLHHSTGSGVYFAGEVESWINDFNTGNGTEYSIAERNYPDTPWPWTNYPYDYWKLWLGGECDNSEPGIECLESIASQYELVIFKHCFPGASIQPDAGSPDVNSVNQTLENYKVQYKALLQLMDGMLETKFMIWTLAPLHRLSTNSEDAGRANEFVNWVKNDFLNEDGKEHPNIYVFDFYGAVAELSDSPENGQQYCLKYDFEQSHDGDDSHPNISANKYVGPLFGRAVVDALSGKVISSVSTKCINEEQISIYPQPVAEILNIELQSISSSHFVQIVSIDGKIVIEKELQLGQNFLDASELHAGLYILKAKSGQETFIERFIKN